MNFRSRLRCARPYYWVILSHSIRIRLADVPLEIFEINLFILFRCDRSYIKPADSIHPNILWVPESIAGLTQPPSILNTVFVSNIIDLFGYFLKVLLIPPTLYHLTVSYHGPLLYRLFYV